MFAMLHTLQEMHEIYGGYARSHSGCVNHKAGAQSCHDGKARFRTLDYGLGQDKNDIRPRRYGQQQGCQEKGGYGVNCRHNNFFRPDRSGFLRFGTVVAGTGVATFLCSVIFSIGCF